MTTALKTDQTYTIHHSIMGKFEGIFIKNEGIHTIIKITNSLDSQLHHGWNIGDTVHLITERCQFTQKTPKTDLKHALKAHKQAKECLRVAIQQAIPAGARIDYEIATGRISRNLIVQPHGDWYIDPYSIHVCAPNGKYGHIDIHQITRVHGQPFSLEPQP